MSGLNRSFGLLGRWLKPVILSKASISSKPAKHNLSTAEQAIGMVTLFAAVMLPAGWILANLEEYKKR